MENEVASLRGKLAQIKLLVRSLIRYRRRDQILYEQMAFRKQAELMQEISAQHQAALQEQGRLEIQLQMARSSSRDQDEARDSWKKVCTLTQINEDLIDLNRELKAENKRLKEKVEEYEGRTSGEISQPREEATWGGVLG